MGVDFDLSDLFKATAEEETGGLGDIEPLSLLGWRRFFISSTHGRLLINTCERGARDPGDRLDSSVEDITFVMECTGILNVQI